MFNILLVLKLKSCHFERKNTAIADFCQCYHILANILAQIYNNYIKPTRKIGKK